MASATDRHADAIGHLRRAILERPGDASLAQRAADGGLAEAKALHMLAYDMPAFMLAGSLRYGP